MCLYVLTVEKHTSRLAFVGSGISMSMKLSPQEKAPWDPETVCDFCFSVLLPLTENTTYASLTYKEP